VPLKFAKIQSYDENEDFELQLLHLKENKNHAPDLSPLIDLLAAQIQNSE